MKRRTLKKDIAKLAQRLVAPTRKYLAATPRVHRDTIYRHEREMEFVIVDLMSSHLTLDSLWPHRRRWLDGLSEGFSWRKKNDLIYGEGELFWGHWPEVGREITGLRFTTEINLCARHGVEYIFRYGSGVNVRSYCSRRWCPTRV